MGVILVEEKWRATGWIRSENTCKVCFVVENNGNDDERFSNGRTILSSLPRINWDALFTLSRWTREGPSGAEEGWGGGFRGRGETDR